MMAVSVFIVKLKLEFVHLEKNSMTFTVGKYLFKGNHKDARISIGVVLVSLYDSEQVLAQRIALDIFSF